MTPPVQIGDRRRIPFGHWTIVVGVMPIIDDAVLLLNVLGRDGKTIRVERVMWSEWKHWRQA